MAVCRFCSAKLDRARHWCDRCGDERKYWNTSLQDKTHLSLESVLRIRARLAGRIVMIPLAILAVTLVVGFVIAAAVPGFSSLPSSVRGLIGFAMVILALNLSMAGCNPLDVQRIKAFYTGSIAGLLVAFGVCSSIVEEFSASGGLAIFCCIVGLIIGVLCAAWADATWYKPRTSRILESLKEAPESAHVQEEDGRISCPACKQSFIGTLGPGGKCPLCGAGA